MAEDPTKPGNENREEPSGERTRRVTEQDQAREKKTKISFWQKLKHSFSLRSYSKSTLLMIAGGLVVLGLAILLAVHNIYFSSDSSAASGQVPFIRATATLTPRPTPTPNYEEEIERGVIDSVNYRRELTMLPPLKLATAYVLYARDYLNPPATPQPNQFEIDGLPPCEDVCTFDMPTPSGISVIFAKVREIKQNVVEKTMDMIEEKSFSSDVIYLCQSGNIGVGAMKVDTRLYYVVILVNKLDKCNLHQQ